MALDTVRSVIWSQRLVLVRPSSRFWWEVAIEGAEKPHSFPDRRLAIGYAKLWAAANAPSRVNVLGPKGAVDQVLLYP